MALTKEDIAREVAIVLELPEWGRREKAYEIVKAVCTAITEALHRGETVTVRGFGKFEIKERKAHKHRCYFPDPRHPNRIVQMVDLPAKSFVSFKPDNPLLDYLSEDEQCTS